MDARALVAEAEYCGVSLRVVGGRLVASPAERLPRSLQGRLVAQRTAVAAVLTPRVARSRDPAPDEPVVNSSTVVDLPEALTPEEEAVVIRMGNYLERQYQSAAATRLRCGSGLPGAQERDARMRAARAQLENRASSSSDGADRG